MAENVTSSLPEFETTDVCGAVAPSSMSFDPNDSDAGERDSSVWMPVPVSDTVRSGTFELTVPVADFAPVVVGLNSTRTLHVWPAVSTVEDVQSVPCPVKRLN